MSGSDEDRTITDWRTESRFYRRKPGVGWLLALSAIPVLLALIGLGTLQRFEEGRRPRRAERAGVGDADGAVRPGDEGPGDDRTRDDRTRRQAPGAGFAPFSILRSGNGFTLAGELPDAT